VQEDGGQEHHDRRVDEEDQPLERRRDVLKPDEIQQALAKRYAELFTVFQKHREVIDRVTFWGVADADSWLNNWPIKRRTNYPLLFDRSGQPKPAFYSVINTVNSEKETRRGHRGHYDN